MVVCCRLDLSQLGVDADILLSSSRHHVAEQAAYVLLGDTSSVANTSIIASFTTLVATGAWTTVPLPKSFVSPVVVCTPVYDYCEACHRYGTHDSAYRLALTL